MQTADLEMMIADFQRKQFDLSAQIRAEEERTGINDATHFNYPTAARAAVVRRDNLTKSIDDLTSQLGDARENLEGELAELRKLELMLEKDGDLRRQLSSRDEGRRMEMRR